MCIQQLLGGVCYICLLILFDTWHNASVSFLSEWSVSEGGVEKSHYYFTEAWAGSKLYANDPAPGHRARPLNNALDIHGGFDHGGSLLSSLCDRVSLGSLNCNYICFLVVGTLTIEPISS